MKFKFQFSIFSIVSFATLLIVGFVTDKEVWAADCPATINSSVSGPCTIAVGGVSVTSTGSVSSTVNSLVGGTTSGGISNSGLINIIGGNGVSDIYLNNTTLTSGIVNSGTISGDIPTSTAINVGYSTINGSILNNVNGIISGGSNGIEARGAGIGMNHSTLTGGITNNGLIAGSVFDSTVNPAYNYTSALNIYLVNINGDIVNNAGATFSGGNWGMYLDNLSIISGSIINSGVISAIKYGAICICDGTAVGGNIINNASGVIRGGLQSNGIAIDNNGSYFAGNIQNNGLISGGNGISITNYSNLVGNISNTNLVEGGSSSGNAGIYIDTSSSVGSITNTGSILGNVAINNQGIINTLNNAQGAGNTNGALTYTGTLPTNYNIIINSANSFGKLAVSSGTGTTAFGIYTGSSVSNNTKYTAVLSGLTSSQVTNTSGTYGGYSWALSLESGSSDIWDLIFATFSSQPTGPSVANTNQSLVNTASALQGTYTLQNSVLANSFSYDCNVFGANNVCVSAGGRNTQVQAANGLNNTSGLLIAAYRPHPNYRIGAYADQNLSVSNPGGTVNLGNSTPLIGLFGAWNDRLDGSGTEVKVSAAYGQKNATVTRSVVGSGSTASEAGSGSSNLNSQGAQITAKYGFAVSDNALVSPYVGIRYTQNNMGGYTEATSSSVTAPLTYSALNTNATTALAGVGASYRVIPAVTTFASAGVETDTNTANGTYSATNTSIGVLTPVNFNANPVRTRPTATIGAYYDIEKNQRLGVTGIYRQEAYQAVSTTTVMATYTIGL